MVMFEIVVIIVVGAFLLFLIGKNIPISSISLFKSIGDHFASFEQVQSALREAGMESSNLIIGIDYTRSNEESGIETFGGNCLHLITPESISEIELFDQQQQQQQQSVASSPPSLPPKYENLYPNPVAADSTGSFFSSTIASIPNTTTASTTHLNPYQQVIKILCSTLEKFDDDGLIPVFGFGDAKTTNHSVFPFYRDGHSCNGFQGVLKRYNEITPTIKLSGPTNFAPIINRAIKVQQQNGNQFTILIIITDGMVTNVEETRRAIVEATNHPLSIVVVGVGDGPFDLMKEFDDELPERRFDNFQFVYFNEVMTMNGGNENPEVAFAVACLMEIPEQYKAIRKLNLLQ